jgi:hypothetical protein
MDPSKGSDGPCYRESFKHAAQFNVTDLAVPGRLYARYDNPRHEIHHLKEAGQELGHFNS